MSGAHIAENTNTEKNYEYFKYDCFPPPPPPIMNNF